MILKIKPIITEQWQKQTYFFKTKFSVAFLSIYLFPFRIWVFQASRWQSKIWELTLEWNVGLFPL
jgi:hypothetical protein